MYVQKFARGGRLRQLVCVGVVYFAGCGVAIGPEETGGVSPTPSPSTFGFSSESTHLEITPDDFFGSAEYVDLAYGRRLIRGDISAASDVDVYDLGPVLPGDHVVVTMTADPSLDGAIALFDASGNALLINDHRNVYLGVTEPFIDVVIRHESPASYIAVSATPGFESVGEYSLIATKEFPYDQPAARPDVVLLVFDGANDVKIGSRLPVDVPPFDPANISQDFASQTDLMISEIVALVSRDYLPYDVAILSTSEGDRFEPGMTRIYFGSYDISLLGLAEGVDEFNARSSQQAIVFTDTFRALMRLRPSASQVSQAIANVASHEIGHLVGLVHTADPAGIMDVTASLSELIEDQTFTRSPIYSAAFPVGYQDAVQYLLDTVGGDSTLAMTKTIPTDHRSQTARVSDIQGPARLMLRLSTCSLSSP